jgi:template-activating factor I
MAAPKTKRSKTEPEDTVDDEDIQVLEGIQDQIEELNDKATEEILEVERKYNRLRKPMYDKRAESIRKLPEFWFKVVSFSIFNIFCFGKCTNLFYFMKFTSQDMLAALLVGEDLAAFKYMKELNVEDHDDVKSGFKISLVRMHIIDVEHLN